MLIYTTDRAWPGLVALYDIRPGNRAVYFYNPGAHTGPTHLRWKKRSQETKPLRAEPNNFIPLQIALQGAQDGQKLISWRWSLPLPTNTVWWSSIHTILSYRGNRPTHKQKRQDQLQYTAPQLAHILQTVVKVVLRSGGGSPDEARLEQTPYPFQPH